MNEPAVARLLQAAELWTLPPGGHQPALVAGWEDAAPFCAAVCTTGTGLAFCRACPATVALRAIRSHRAVSDLCPGGVRLLAFPAPRGARRQAAVLRVAPPGQRQAAAIAYQVRVSPVALRRAARGAERSDPRAILAAARMLRGRKTLHAWQVQQRDRGADRRRTATAALAQMIATSEEFHLLYRSSQRQVAEIERHRRRLDRLARETLHARDVERARIAHQIHDTAAQSMVSAQRFLEAARAAAAGGRTGSADIHLASATDRLQAAIGEVRSVLASLLPPGLEELGLGHAIRDRVGRLVAGAEVVGQVVGDLPRLEDWVEQALYGMTIEAVSNAIRHAQASTLLVELGERRGRAVIVVRDDGRGFDPATAVHREGEGLGLLGLGRQASWLGGRATVRSSPGSGTVVRISVPMERHLLRPPNPSDARATHARRSPGRRGVRNEHEVVRMDREG